MSQYGGQNEHVNTVIYTLAWIVALLYAVNFSYYYRYFKDNKKEATHQIRTLLVVTVVVHFGYLAAFGLRLGHLPVGNIYQVLSTFAWVSAFVYLALEIRLKVITMGVFFIPVVALFHLSSVLFLDLHQALAPVLINMVFEVHVVFLLAAYAAFAISFISSIMYILLSREMKSKKLGIFFQRLPSLELFDSLSNQAVNIGLVLGMVGVVLGVYMGLNVWKGKWVFDAKIFAVIISIGIYLLHFVARKTAGWQGKRAAVVSVIGFYWLLFSFIFVNLFFSKVHNFQ